MDEETRDHKLRLLAIYQDNLRELEVQSAQHGITPPLIIINQIKGHRKNIDDLRMQLSVNAEEVTLDKLLVGIEDLRKFVQEEGRRVTKEYENLFWDQGMLGFGLFSVFGVGIILARVADWLYQTSILGIPFRGAHDSISYLIYFVGFIIGGYSAFKVGGSITKSKYDELARRLGYDPTERKRGIQNK